MNQFNFYNPTKIIFGRDRFNELDHLVPKDAKVLVLYGGGSVKKFGTLDRVLAALPNREILEFGGIEANPRYETLMKAVDVVRAEKIDFLLAVGGGSVIDGTKFIALASYYDGDGLDLLRDRSITANLKQALPLAAVLTLAATGSEMNRGGVVSSPIGKLGFGNDLVFPKFSLVDPSLTFTLPETQVANGVVDTFVHVMEQYMTYPAEGRFQDRTSEGILKTLIEIGRATIDNPTDYDLRANLVWCATMGLNGLIGAGVPQDWATHRIGHELTALFGIDHAKTLAIIMPSLWNIMRDTKREKLLQYGERVLNITTGSEEDRIDQIIETTRQFFESLGIKTRLSDYGIGADQIDSILAALELHNMTALGERGEITLEISRKILEGAI
ncbi:iron-containing alcohol dehydrogenase [Turicibacter bilis]|uniref:Iron-containing alcohol dehydrogenase n=1 Tax=Turicibacter bilis TaxID=2735723 RepID=A0A9Q9FHG8_9FIRM|nr:iron-containing alcohol dehydrogenase [Turicibacter bilis]MBS3199048.1 iron-containing alcohol dehydrogenase [Turicibacter bilis]MBS3201394.1 iron-containing alcohol dehydrogenase [Turicibacter bilis]UUF05189.1 iron-containing alcohol dehydrogenase [Turicibacter bilis]UUF09355.1 iron-containing alcohol dehydrogenase [Turicibacter bilis]